MTRNFRKERIGEEIKKIVSSMLLRGDIKDPRVTGLVSITAVDVTRDGSYATLYITSFGNVKDEEAREAQNAEVLEGLEHAKGLIRREISKDLKLRHTPELRFAIDDSYEKGLHMDELLDSLAKKEDK